MNRLNWIVGVESPSLEAGGFIRRGAEEVKGEGEEERWIERERER